MMNATPDADRLITPETAIDATAAASRFSVNGRKPHRSAIARYMLDGVVRGDRRVVLASQLFGGRRVTSDAAIDAFKQQLAEADHATRRRRHRHGASEPVRRAELNAANAELEAAGL